jgi:divinyl protochlorophyllide a 8-vinyl-reductase
MPIARTPLRPQETDGPVHPVTMERTADTGRPSMANSSEPAFEPNCDAPGRIGPNAVSQLEGPLCERIGPLRASQIFEQAGLGHAFGHAPQERLDERIVARLHHEVRRSLFTRQAADVLEIAGDRTGLYILAHRIPAPFVVLLRNLPPAWSCRLLVGAIRRHAWTFAGSGHFSITLNSKPRLSVTAAIEHNPVVSMEHSEQPVCIWHAAVFQRLFRELVDPAIEVTETDCCASGSSACRFLIGR